MNRVTWLNILEHINEKTAETAKGYKERKELDTFILQIICLLSAFFNLSLLIEIILLIIR